MFIAIRLWQSASGPVNAGRPTPSPQAIAYRPSQAALAFKYKGESQAEFEERERRCLATAIYFEARGEPSTARSPSAR